MKFPVNNKRKVLLVLLLVSSIKDIRSQSNNQGHIDCNGSKCDNNKFYIEDNKCTCCIDCETHYDRVSLQDCPKDPKAHCGDCKPGYVSPKPGAICVRVIATATSTPPSPSATVMQVEPPPIQSNEGFPDWVIVIFVFAGVIPFVVPGIIYWKKRRRKKIIGNGNFQPGTDLECVQVVNQQIGPQSMDKQPSKLTNPTRSSLDEVCVHPCNPNQNQDGRNVDRDIPLKTVPIDRYEPNAAKTFNPHDVAINQPSFLNEDDPEHNIQTVSFRRPSLPLVPSAITICSTRPILSRNASSNSLENPCDSDSINSSTHPSIYPGPSNATTVINTNSRAAEGEDSPEMGKKSSRGRKDSYKSSSDPSNSDREGHSSARAVLDVHLMVDISAENRSKL